MIDTELGVGLSRHTIKKVQGGLKSFIQIEFQRIY